MNSLPLPILYSFRRCPYAMRARMTLLYCNISVELREVDLKNKPSDLVKISPKATVPVLIQLNGEIVEQSLDIISWALSINDFDGWSDFTIEQTTLADLLIDENDTEFKTFLDKYKYASRFPEFTETHYRVQGEVFLNKLNTILKTSDYLIKNSISYVDIAIAPFIRQFANVNLDWFHQSEYPFLVSWLDSIVNAEIFRQSMIKYPVWVDGK